MSSPAGSAPVVSLPADLALVRAIRAWGGSHRSEPGGEPGALARFAPAERARLAAAWATMTRVTPEVAWQTLLRDHEASARFDPARVHPTWFERILGAESPAVGEIVRQHAPESIRSRLGPNPASAQPGIVRTATAQPVAVAWALTLWSERLVGDIPGSPADPPIVLALAQLGWRDLVRLARVLGQVKQAFARPGTGDVPSATNSAGRVRIGYFRRVVGRPDPRLVPLAQADLAVGGTGRHQEATVGLITVARLLKGCDAHRARWAIQHIPYPVARQLGTLVGGEAVAASGLPAWAVRAWESWVLEAAWARLLSEGRFSPLVAGGPP